MASAFSFNPHNISLQWVMVLLFTDKKSDTEWFKKKIVQVNNWYIQQFFSDVDTNKPESECLSN